MLLPREAFLIFFEGGLMKKEQKIRVNRKVLITDYINNYAVCYKRIGKTLFDFIILKKWSFYGEMWFDRIYPSPSWEGDLTKEDFLKEIFGSPLKDIKGAGNDRIVIYDGAFYFKGAEIKGTEEDDGVFRIKYNAGTRKFPKWEELTVECQSPYPFVSHSKPGRGEWEVMVVSQKKIDEKKFYMTGEGKVSIPLSRSA